MRVRFQPVARRSLLGATVLALLAVVALPAVALAHPLGNFTINHYAGLRVTPDRIELDVVIDQAELPTFTERQRIDTDGDGTVSDEELAAERLVACGRLAGSLHVTVDGKAVPLTAFAAGMSMPPGAAGLSTMRTVCEYTAPISIVGSGAAVVFEDRSFPQRIGWREIRVQGDGTSMSDGSTVSADGKRSPADLSADLGSGRLTAYPASLIAQPPSMTGVSFRVQAGGAALAPYTAPDASPLPGVPQPTAAATPSPTPAGIGSVSAPVVSAPGPTAIPGSASIPTGAVPGGVQDQIAGLLATKDLSPLALIGSLLLAAFLGALHAISPGHGKTVMAAYLVGSRGSARHAAALGLTVTVSHTLGVLALAAVALFAAQLIPPERLYPILGLASGVTVIGIGGWLLLGRLRLIRRSRALAAAHAAEHDHDHEHGHEHQHEHERPHEHAIEAAAGEHSHGGVRHSHVPVGGDLTWRSLFALGLAGGLVPSASALLLLLGSLAANRAGYGLVLVIAFGAGMAIVLAGIGLALVYATRWIERVPRGSSFQRAWDLLPLGTAVVVVIAGVYLTSQSLLVTF
jgi:nickel/cobalt transporter (NicO) family protein